MPQPRQPFLHSLLVAAAAPTQVLCTHAGDIAAFRDRPTAEGVLHADVRVVSRLDVLVGGEAGEHIATEQVGPTSTFTWLLRHLSDDPATADPQVRLDRIRRVRPGQVDEELVISSVLNAPIVPEVVVRLGCDFLAMPAMRAGATAPGQAFTPVLDGDRARWSNTEVGIVLSAPGAVLSVDADVLHLTWRPEVAGHGDARLTWSLRLSDAGGAVVASAAEPLAVPRLSGADQRLRPWLERALADLDGLRMCTPEAPGDTFFAAGAPWYLTLFGRDSLWAARLLLPLDLRPALGTLRVLARRQGVRNDETSAEQPGKILHELRRAAFALGDITLPALYYGTIDATPLWVCLLHDAWQAGLADPDVAELLPALEAALRWLVEDGDADGDGFLEYLDLSGHGLANQGWKDSADSVRFADGSIATGAVALCEVQGYAYEAATAGAALLDAFDRPGAERLRVWAHDLQARFRAQFWCGEGDERYPALALDGAKRRVDALTSNIGHLLGTGLLDPAEELIVAQHLAGPALDSGLGLRTMSSEDGGYSPLSYHCGSVWPHDTAIAIAGLVRSGLASWAGGLIEGLLRASVAWEQRLPELYSGEGRPVPYPAACRPQAWSAAAAVVVAHALGALDGPRAC